LLLLLKTRNRTPPEQVLEIKVHELELSGEFVGFEALEFGITCPACVRLHVLCVPRSSMAQGGI
jgi:hypothetical protein